MKNIEPLIKIAEHLELGHFVQELEQIQVRSGQENANLILPLVGEFDSGKTTLINALTDNKQLETASKPTTATIFEVHFGCDTCFAKVLNADGATTTIEDISLLKNEFLSDAKVVTVFDTSNRVSSNTILVDTPGLSSPDPKHKQTLVDFLPQADGILLVSDINQQLTRSLTDFIETMQLSGRPIFLILTKSDTKSMDEIDAAKRYISENCKLPLKQVVAVSAVKDILAELYALLDSINKDKRSIIEQVDAHRTKLIASSMLSHVQTLLKASNNEKEIEEAVRQSEHELDKLKRSIEQIINEVSDDISNQESLIVRRFEDLVTSKLNGLINGKSTNFDAEAISIINTTSSLLMNEYRTTIKSLLCEKVRNSKGDVPLESLQLFDMSSYQMSGLSYNLDLNNMGHEYDKWIKDGVIAVGSIAAIAVTGGAATGAVASGAVGTAFVVDNVIDIADTVSDVGSMISNNKAAKRVEQATSRASGGSASYGTSDAEQRSGQTMGGEKGLIDSLIGLVTEKTMSKPQRSHAVRTYVDSSLIPEFKLGLNSVSQQVIINIRDNIYSESAAIIEQKRTALSQLKMEMNEQKELFMQRKEQLKQFSNELLTY